MFGTNDSGKNKLSGVSCSVSSCQFHSSASSCSAPGIKVEPEHANDTSETLCSTYKHKPGQ